MSQAVLSSCFQYMSPSLEAWTESAETDEDVQDIAWAPKPTMRSIASAHNFNAAALARRAISDQLSLRHTHLHQEDIYKSLLVLNSYEVELIGETIDSLISGISTSARAIFSAKTARQPILQRELLPALERIEKIKRLRENWNGHGGRPALPESTSNCMNFLSNLQLEQKFRAVPTPMLNGDGRVGLFWKDAGNYISISFPGDFTFSCYCESSEGAEYMKSGIKISPFHQLPDELKGFLARMV